MLRIRLSRTGKTSQESFRIVVAEHSDAVKGKYKELLGHYVPASKDKKFDVKKEEVKKLLDSIHSTRSTDSTHSHDGFYLDFIDVYKILNAYGLPVIHSLIASDIETSKKLAKEIGYPVVIKAIGRELIHKTEVGGVLIDIHDDTELEHAEDNLIKKLKSKGLQDKLEGFLIQPYLRGGIETIMGVFNDTKAGHLVMFGLGGVMVEVLKDVKFKLLPITDIEADQLIKSVQCYKLLKGVRGKPSVDFEFIKDCLLRLSQLIEDFPEFTEIDFNPFVFSHNAEECKILDARMKVKCKVNYDKQ